jgi:hypothetical protein
VNSLAGARQYCCCLHLISATLGKDAAHFWSALTPLDLAHLVILSSGTISQHFEFVAVDRSTRHLRHLQPCLPSMAGRKSSMSTIPSRSPHRTDPRPSLLRRWKPPERRCHQISGRNHTGDLSEP